MSYNFELDLDTENALTKIIQQISSASTILEFGPANGRLTKYLKEALNCNIYIVEIDAEAAKDAMKYAEDGIVDDIENFLWLDQWKEVAFDYIIFADVLEHLRNPQLVLKQTKLLLKDEGKVLISVPNVAHNSLLINLYNNIFEYTPVGLLDNTHIHLFAYNTLKEFCHYAGFVPVIEDATYSRVGANEVNASYTQVPRNLAKVLKQRKFSNVYQFIFTLQKKDFVENNNVTFQKNILLTLPEYHIKVYVDRGNGWDEDNCIDYSVRLEKNFEAEISLDSTIKSLRIDPLDVNGVIKINKVSIQCGNELTEFDGETIKHTGWVKDNTLFDPSDDPQIVIDNLNISGNCTLYLNFEYILYDVEPESIELIKIQRELEAARIMNVMEQNKCEQLKILSVQISALQSEINLLKEKNSNLALETKKIFEEKESVCGTLRKNIAELKLSLSELSTQKQDLQIALNKGSEINIALEKQVKEFEQKIALFKHASFLKRVNLLFYNSDKKV